jgi:hypothetical protein
MIVAAVVVVIRTEARRAPAPQAATGAAEAVPIAEEG